MREDVIAQFLFVLVTFDGDFYRVLASGFHIGVFGTLFESFGELYRGRSLVVDPAGPLFSRHFEHS